MTVFCCCVTDALLAYCWPSGHEPQAASGEGRFHRREAWWGVGGRVEWYATRWADVMSRSPGPDPSRSGVGEAGCGRRWVRRGRSIVAWAEGSGVGISGCESGAVQWCASVEWCMHGVDSGAGRGRGRDRGQVGSQWSGKCGWRRTVEVLAGMGGSWSCCRATRSPRNAGVSGVCVAAVRRRSPDVAGTSAGTGGRGRRPAVEKSPVAAVVRRARRAAATVTCSISFCMHEGLFYQRVHQHQDR